MVIVRNKLSVSDLDKNKKIIFQKSNRITYTITKNKNTFFVSTSNNKVYQGSKEDIYRFVNSTNLIYKKSVKDYRYLK